MPRITFRSTAKAAIEPDDRFGARLRHRKPMSNSSKVFAVALKSRKWFDDPRVRLLRGWPRRATGLSVVIECRRRRGRVLVRDPSRLGVGRAGLGGLPADAQVVIELENGRRLEGRLHWRIAGRGGVLFHEPLAASDQLLMGNAWKLLARCPICRGGEPPSAGEGRPPASIAPRAAGDWVKSILGKWRALAKAAAGSLHRRWASWRSARAHVRRDQLAERACRKQGFAWLTDAEAAAECLPHPRKHGRPDVSQLG